MLTANRKGFVPLPENPDTARTLASLLGALTAPNPPPAAGGDFLFLFLLGLVAKSSSVDCLLVDDDDDDDDTNEKDDASRQHDTAIVTSRINRIMSGWMDAPVMVVMAYCILQQLQHNKSVEEKRRLPRKRHKEAILVPSPTCTSQSRLD